MIVSTSIDERKSQQGSGAPLSSPRELKPLWMLLVRVDRSRLKIILTIIIALFGTKARRHKFSSEHMAESARFLLVLRK